MIPVTGVTDPKPLVTGWLADYVDAASHNTYPYSFHILSALLALGAIVGRRAFIKGPTYYVWPPIAVLLVGDSGVGKGGALGVAADIVGIASEEIPCMVATQESHFTPRGMMNKWVAMQENAPGQPLEGLVVVGELSGTLREAKGNERICSWMIDALDTNKPLRDTIGHTGESEVFQPTISFGCSSVLRTLVSSVSLDQFVGGFMWRFLMAYELWGMEREDIHLETATKEKLAEAALEIRAQAPHEMAVDPPAHERWKDLRKDMMKATYTDSALAGWFNRYGSWLQKLALLYALSERRGTILLEDIERADTFLDKFLYPPTKYIVGVMGLKPAWKHFLTIHEDLCKAQTDGMLMSEFYKKLGFAGSKGQVDAIASMETSGLAYVSGLTDRVYASAAFKSLGEQRLCEGLSGV